MMIPRRGPGGRRLVDVDAEWQRLRATAGLELLGQHWFYDDHGAPLGQAASSFQLWAIFGTWTTVN